MRLVSIDGSIGSGKSTIIETLQERFKNTENIILVKEPVNIWLEIKGEDNRNILEHFYEDKTKYAYVLQTTALLSRYEFLEEAFKRADEIESRGEKVTILTERTLFSDYYIFATMLHEDGYLNKIEFDAYFRWFKRFQFPITKSIYVKANPEVCLKRISVRARDGENKIPLEYLINLDNYHESFYKDILSKNNCLFINNNIDMGEDEYKRQINLICDHVLS